MLEVGRKVNLDQLNFQNGKNGSKYRKCEKSEKEDSMDVLFFGLDIKEKVFNAGFKG